jgi:hypothetical protein
MLYSAIILALISLQTDAADMPPIAPDWATPPIESDIQIVLGNTAQMYSTNGTYNLYDFAVRNIVCGTPKGVSQQPKPDVKEGDGKVFATFFNEPDIRHYEMRCSFEYAALRKKANASRASATRRLGRETPRNFDAWEISRITASAWWREEADLVYISNSKCKYMGRTPQYGECHYWVPLTTISAATAPARIPDADDVQLALLDRWIMQSSSGLYFQDYIIRSLKCGLPQSLIRKPETQKLKYGSVPNKPLHKVRCTFEYSGVLKKEKGREFPHKPRRFSKSELKAIPSSSWRKEEQDIFYMPPSSGHKSSHWLMRDM